jgi:four helix bundle protein
VAWSVTPEELRQRTAAFGRAVMDLTKPLLRDVETEETALQLRDAASAVASNYRAANRAKSHRDFTSKIATVLEEADESLGWLEFLRDCAMISQGAAEPLVAEARQLVAIFTKSHETARRRDEQPPVRPRRRRPRRRRS